MKQKEISPVRLLLRWAGPEKKWLIGSVLCAFGSGLLAITAYLGLYRLMDAVLSGACTPAVIADCAVFVMAGTVGRMVLLGASGVLSHKGAYGALFRVRCMVTEHLAKVPLGALDERSTGAVKTVLNEDIEKLELFLAHNLPEFVAYLTGPVVIFLYLLSVNVPLALVSLLPLPLAGMYMDDWYVICPDKATAVEALLLARLEFAKLGLELNDKTNIFPLQNGIDFCGFHTYLTRTGQVVSKLRYSSIKRMKRRIRPWEKQYAAGEVSREKIMESFTAWEAHAKHGDTKQLRREMRSRLLMALDRADEARRAAGIPAARPGPDERRTKRYGTVTFQSGKRQPGEAGGKQQAHQVHQAGQ